MTFRAGKRHKVQESSKSTKNIQKLASKLQHFVNTGKAPKRDLRIIDDQISSFLIDQGKRIIQLLDQLKEHTPNATAKETLEGICAEWSSWLEELGSRDALGYCSVKLQKDIDRNALLESAIDADANLFSMLSAFNDSMVGWVSRASYEVPDWNTIQSCAREIIDAHREKQKILSRLAA